MNPRMLIALMELISALIFAVIIIYGKLSENSFRELFYYQTIIYLYIFKCWIGRVLNWPVNA